jgi:ESF2/ABP1 family protein
MSEQESGSEHEVEEGIQEYEDEEETEPTTEPPAKKRKRAPLADADEFQKKMRKTGVLYISHMPPRMRPMHVRNLLQDYGTVLRVYCELERTLVTSSLFLTSVCSGGKVVGKKETWRKQEEVV